ncbi:Cupin_8 domain-containing protein [Cephalotus follicularis]|uniref:Cupin_8 domain-containing protein n=1 Tax=Cephalotus follicularis TaxID=3775 RepID=A0A1Q3CW44_CEPFO|nr:Cupin_8 domain-containing protein [Cephalotus follicularis]
MEVSLQIRKFEFDQLPSAAEFTSQIEPNNVPAVFCGCIKDWNAFSKWNPSNGGLDYLQELVGSFTVEAMLSRSAPVFYGDLRSHERVPLQFSSFIGICKQRMENKDDGHGGSFESERNQVSDSEAGQCGLLSGDAALQQLYLAQISIMNIENEDRVQLETLREDIQTPALLETKTLASINLWMNSSHARSSTHYDPHHNLLCVVSGRKQVVLWPPSASPMLYPMPVYGEASNHSSVALGRPDLSIHPRAECSMEYSQKVILQEGDALFIPEGWFHQIDSDDLTIAVNFWWQSNVMSRLSEHMDAYYMRRILRRLTDNEMNQVLHKASTIGIELPKRHICVQSCSEDHGDHNLNQSFKRKKLQGNELQQRIILHDMEPCALQDLHELVSLVHDRVNMSDQSQPVQPPSTNGSAVNEKYECNRTVAAHLYRLEDDPVAKFLWTLDSYTLQHIFLAMAHNFPRTLEALILYLLSPVCAEVLTRKFDEIDQQTTEEDRTKF